MADISMCLGKKCKIKETCYRYRAEADKFWQSYSEFDPGKDGKSCLDYWNCEQQKKIGVIDG
jgi:hypothetical protein